MMFAIRFAVWRQAVGCASLNTYFVGGWPIDNLLGGNVWT